MDIYRQTTIMTRNLVNQEWRQPIMPKTNAEQSLMADVGKIGSALLARLNFSKRLTGYQHLIDQSQIFHLKLKTTMMTRISFLIPRSYPILQCAFETMCHGTLTSRGAFHMKMHSPAKMLWYVRTITQRLITYLNNAAPFQFTIQSVISRELYLHNMTIADRRIALDVARSLQSQFFFFEVETGSRLLQDNVENVYVFMDEQLGSQDPVEKQELPTGVVVTLTKCYSTNCRDSFPCYSPRCPLKVRTATKFHRLSRAHNASRESHFLN